MTPSASRNAYAFLSGVRSAGFISALVLTTAGCVTGTELLGTHAASTRPAVKVTCPDVGWAPPPELALEQTDRELVGFGPTLLGVETTWAGTGLTVRTVAGGYVDDLTEPYDDLAVAGAVSVSGGIEAEVLRGSLQGTPVLAVLWRDPVQQVPCDVHALLAVGVERGQEAEVLRGLG